MVLVSNPVLLRVGGHDSRAARHQFAARYFLVADSILSVIVTSAAEISAHQAADRSKLWCVALHQRLWLLLRFPL